MFLSFFPILLLVMAVGSFLRYQQTRNDIFWVLCAISAVMAFAWGVVIAHWSVQLIALLLLIKFRIPILDTAVNRID